MDKLGKFILFGESEKGRYCRGYFCENLPELVEKLGHPPPESRGIYFAIQALLYEHPLVYFRVEEEGFSYKDYLEGIRQIKKKGIDEGISAICIPGVGDGAIIKAVTPICEEQHSIMITTESDLFDYLSSDSFGA